MKPDNLEVLFLSENVVLAAGLDMKAIMSVVKDAF